jgi:hypothetical protein
MRHLGRFLWRLLWCVARQFLEPLAGLLLIPVWFLAWVGVSIWKAWEDTK